MALTPCQSKTITQARPHSPEASAGSRFCDRQGGSKWWVVAVIHPPRVMGIPIASGFEKHQEDVWPPIAAFDWEAESWDCPSCNSLLLAIVCIDSYATKDTDSVTCPICGDKSKRIYSSHWPQVECLIPGAYRLTEAEADELV